MVGWQAKDKAVAITGAGGVIGKALGLALARAGARSILALDLNLTSAEAAAAEMAAAGSSCAVRSQELDASDGAALRAALQQADAADPLDLFCANAGVLAPGDCAEAALSSGWEKSWSLNVMQTAVGAEVLIPRMAARGGGAFLVTASAAGLLSQLGSAPYTATKHAAVGLAEWLAISHAHQGITVCCICPQAVAGTEMLRTLEGGAGGPSAQGLTNALRAAALDGLLAPSGIADEALECLARGTFLCVPGGDGAALRHVRRKEADRERWIGAMRKLQARLLGGQSSGEGTPAPRAML
jgi:NAD(P)-dependent dehydrogenase (short-subunit alcohol dehydrogenase family)